MGKKMIERYGGLSPVSDGKGQIIDRKYGYTIIEFSFPSSESENAKIIYDKCMELLEKL